MSSTPASTPPNPPEPPQPGPFMTQHAAIILLAGFVIGLVVGGLTFLSGTPAMRRGSRRAVKRRRQRACAAHPDRLRHAKGHPRFRAGNAIRPHFADVNRGRGAPPAMLGRLTTPTPPWRDDVELAG